MPVDLRAYAKALWRHWATYLTGGSLMALVAIWVFFGGSVSKIAGPIIVGMTLFHATYSAWKEERVARTTESTPRIEIRSWQPRLGASALPLTITNPDREPVSLENDWTLTVTTADGTIMPAISGHFVGEIRPLQPAERFNVEVLFDGFGAVGEQEALRGSHFDLVVTDIRGRRVTARYDVQ